MAFPSALILLTAIAILSRTTDTLHFVSFLEYDPAVHACVNGSILLPWDVSLSTGESIVDIQWFFNGFSEEMMAIYSNNHFVALPGYSGGRVEFIANAGLAVHGVNDQDAGNYSVKIDVLGANGTLITLRDAVVVEISDGLPTTNGELHAQINQGADFNDTTKEFHVVLSCGDFVYVSKPPFDLVWQTPSGEELSNSFYLNGRFQLRVPNPVLSGKYACKVPARFAASACVPGDLLHTAQASVNVGSLEARQTLSEANTLLLRQDLDQVVTKNLLLRKELDQVVEVNMQQSQLIYQLNNTAVNELRKNINALVTHHVSFTAHVTSDRKLSSGQTVVFGNILHNLGNAYSSNSGAFTAPYQGVYFFALTTEPGHGDYANAEIVSSRYSRLCVVRSGTYNEVESCQAAVHLYAGDRVWVRSYDDSNYFLASQTSFTGFLINIDFN